LYLLKCAVLLDILLDILLIERVKDGGEEEEEVINDNDVASRPVTPVEAD